MSYRLDRQRDRSRLTFELHEVPRGELGLGFRYDRDYEFTGAIEFRTRDFLNPGAELSLRALLGNAKLGEVRLRYPILGETFFEPLVLYQRQPRFLPAEVNGAKIRVPFREDRLRFFLGFGSRFGRSVLVRAGYELERVYIQQTIRETAEWNGGFRIEGIFDDRDSAVFPSRGSRLVASLRLVEDKLGGNFSYQRYQAQAETFLGVGSRNTLGLVGHWGLVRGRSPFYEGFFSGGAGYISLASHPFPGLERDNILSEHTAQVGFDYRYLLSDLSLSFVDRVYLGGSYRVGLFSRPGGTNKFLPLLHGFSGGIFFQTHFLGPISLQFSGTDVGDFTTYLLLGYFF